MAQSLLHDEEARHRGQAGEPAPRPRTCLSRSSHHGRPAHRDDTPGRPTEQPSTPLGPRVTPSSPGRGGPTAATGGCGGPPPREGCGGAWRPAGLPRAVAHAVTDLSPRDAGPQPRPEGRLAWSPRSPRAWQPALSPQGTRNDALPPRRRRRPGGSRPAEGCHVQLRRGHRSLAPATQPSTEPLQVSKSSGPQGACTSRSKGAWHFQGQKGPRPGTGHGQGELRQSSDAARRAAGSESRGPRRPGGTGLRSAAPGASELRTGGRPSEGPCSGRWGASPAPRG